MTSPRYQGLQAESIPTLQSADGKARIHLISGAWNGVSGPVESITGNFMATIDADEGARLSFDGLLQRNVFLYVVSGNVRTDGRELAQHNLVELDLAGDELVIDSIGNSRLLFGHGAPINEPVVAHGPFVMNTVEEIRQAIVDYQAGKFGAVPA